jgi:uncharacterized protein
MILSFYPLASVVLAAGPSFNCNQVRGGSVEETICKDGGLSALDVKMANVYKAAAKKAANEHPPVLKVEQRGWIKGRNDCWKSDNPRQCIEGEYKRRIAELQARYRLVPFKGPVYFSCDDPFGELIVVFFKTDPPTLTAERGDSVSLMYLQQSGSGSRYQGRNESFWEHQGEAKVTWGHETKEMTCKPAR